MDSNVQHFIPWMSVKRLLKPLLVKSMTYQANASCQNKEPIQVANLHDVCNLSLQIK